MRVPVSLLLLLSSLASGATATFNSTDTHIVYGGLWTDDGPWKRQTCVDMAGWVATTVVGTQGEANIWQEYTWYVSVDGGAPTTLSTTGSGAFAYSTLFTGLSDGPHTVRFGANNSAYVQNTGTIRVTGSGPDLQTNTEFATPLLFNDSAWISVGQLYGAPVLDTGTCGSTNEVRFWGKNSTYSQFGGESGIPLRGNPTSLYLWHYANGQQIWAVYQDGAPIGSTTTPTNTGAWSFVQVASGLSGTHTYEIRNIKPNGWTLSYGVIAGNASSLIPVPARDTVLWYGDSIIAEDLGQITDARQGAPFLLGTALSLGIRRWGADGDTVTSPPGDLSTATTVNNIMAGSGVKYAVANGGVNDANNSISIGNCATAGTFTGDYVSMLTRMATNMATNGTLFVQGILPNSLVTLTVANNYRSAEAAAVACYNASKTNNVTAVYVDTSTWIDGTAAGSGGLDLYDNVHPNARGYSKIAVQWIGIFARYVYGCNAYAGGMMNGCSSTF